jgi:diguanylate cyclase (GGDEF)-like protein
MAPYVSDGGTGATLLRDPILRALAGVHAFALLGPDWPWLAGLAWVITAAVQVLEVRLCLAAARVPGVPRATRRFWYLFLAASALFAGASAAQLALSVTDPGDPDVATGGNGHAVLLAAGAACLILALLTSPLGLATRRERIRFWLDAGTVMIAVALLVFQFTDVSGSAVAGDSALTGFAVALVGPAAFLVVVFGAVKLTLAGVAPFTRLAGVVGVTAGAIEGVTTGLAGPLLAAGRSSWLLGLAVVGNVWFAAAVRVHLLQVRTDVAALRRGGKRPYSRLPYATIVVTYGLLVWVLAERGLTVGAWVVLVGAILSTAVVVLRQLAAFADNAQLVARLHEALAERDELAGRLRFQAFHDNLTGLPNRAMFLERLADELARGGSTGVVIVDLDDFKPVNDRYGHAVGDALLRVVSERLAGCVGPGDLVARLGGDEFAIVLSGPTPELLAGLPGRLARTLDAPIALAGTTLRVQASLGLAVDHGGVTAVGALMHDADLAMYADKERGKARAGVGAGAAR